MFSHLFCLLAINGAVAVSSANSTQKLNVLFIIFDDLRPNSGIYGVGQASMPNFDALANKSMTFDRAYCQQATCGPSRASLLSGRRPDTTQMWNFVGGFRETPGANKWHTWPEYFRSHGYTAYGVGKLFHPGDPANFDQGRSWDHWGGYNGQGKCPATNCPKTACGTDWLAAPELQPGCKGCGMHGCAVTKGAKVTYPDEVTLDTAKGYLKDAKAGWEKGSPFWLGVGFVKPHMPQVFPSEYLSHIPATADIKVAKSQKNPANTSAIEWGNAQEQSSWEKPFSTDVQQQYRRGYYAAAAFSDNLMGQLLSTLQEQGLQDDTIVIVTGDHGWGLGEHNHWIKYTNWETDARVPLIIHHPKKPATWGSRQDAIVEHVDLYPTTAELVGHPVDTLTESIEGRSYAKFFDGESGKDFTAAYTQYPRCYKNGPDYNFLQGGRCARVSKSEFSHMGYSVRTPQWRYTEWALWNGKQLKPEWQSSVPSFGSELYAHGNEVGTDVFDETENENLAFHPEYQQVVKQLSKQVRDFFSGGPSPAPPSPPPPSPPSPPSPPAPPSPSPPSPPSPPTPVPSQCGTCRVCFNPANHKCQADGAHRPKTKAACEAKGHIWCGPSTSEQYV